MAINKRKILKISLFVLGGLVVLLLIGLIILRMMLPGIVKSQIEKFGNESLGVKTTLESVELSILAGSVSLKGLKLEQPDGFQGEQLLSLGQLDTNVSLSSLLTSTIVINSVELSALDVNFRTSADGSRNLETVMTNLLGKPEEPVEEHPTEEPEQPQTEQPVEEEKTSTGVFIKSIVIADASIGLVDEYAGTSTVLSDVAFDRLTVGNYRYTAEPASYESEYLSATLENLAISMDGGYSQSSLVSIDTLQYAMDLNRYLANSIDQEIYIDNFELVNTKINGEYIENYHHQEKPDNFEDFGIVWTNATTNTPPAKFPEREIPEKTEEKKDEKNMVQKALKTTKDAATGAVSEATDVAKDTAELAVDSVKSVGEGLTSLIEEEEEQKQSDEEQTTTSFVLRNALISEFIYNVSAPDGGDKPVSVDRLYLKAANISYPQVDGDPGSIDLKLNSDSHDIEIDITGSGSLAEDSLSRNRTAKIHVKNFPLWWSDQIDDGVLSTDMEADITDGVLSGSLTLGADDLEASSEANSFTKYTLRTISFLSTLGVGKTPVKFHVPVEGSSPQQLVLLLLKSIAETAASATTAIKDKSGDAIKDSTKGLMDKIKKPSLPSFGGDKKDEEEKEETEEE